MYGYLTSSGYKGLVCGRWMLFATDTESVSYTHLTLPTNSLV